MADGTRSTAEGLNDQAEYVPRTSWGREIDFTSHQWYSGQQRRRLTIIRVNKNEAEEEKHSKMVYFLKLSSSSQVR